MPTDTTLELSKATCFKDDLALIKRLGEVLEAKEKAAFAQQHTLARALAVLAKDLGVPAGIEAADQAKAQAEPS